MYAIRDLPSSANPGGRRDRNKTCIYSSEARVTRSSPLFVGGIETLEFSASWVSSESRSFRRFRVLRAWTFILDLDVGALDHCLCDSFPIFVDSGLLYDLHWPHRKGSRFVPLWRISFFVSVLLGVQEAFISVVGGEDAPWALSSTALKSAHVCRGVLCFVSNLGWSTCFRERPPE